MWKTRPKPRRMFYFSFLSTAVCRSLSKADGRSESKAGKIACRRQGFCRIPFDYLVPFDLPGPFMVCVTLASLPPPTMIDPLYCKPYLP